MKGSKGWDILYHTREEMRENEEVKNLLNKPWFRQKRGGVQQKKLKEGIPKGGPGVRSVIRDGGAVQ